jgi:uncharacterized membrane protein YkoI
MKATQPRAVCSVSAAFLLATAAPTAAFTGQELAREAKITIDQARAIALKAHPGRIVTEELEPEAGGSGLRYTLGIESGTVTQEVGVDAKTGEVLENTPD